MKKCINFDITSLLTHLKENRRSLQFIFILVHIVSIIKLEPDVHIKSLQRFTNLAWVNLFVF